MTKAYSTSRLNVYKNCDINDDELNEILDFVIASFTNNVVKYLPSYFNNIKTKHDANKWYKNMLEQSEFFIVKRISGNIIGFLFTFKDHDQINIAYLFKEEFWNKGFASEVLISYISFIKKTKTISKLVAGVTSSNTSSIKLLKKLNFTIENNTNSNTSFYSLIINSN